jgi:hypothetical protein
MKRIIAGACVALACTAGPAGAADTGELWEVTTQMNMAGLPAGMGAQSARVCNETGDPKKQAQTGQMQKCKVTDFKQSGNKVNMTLTCPDGTALIEHTYNAAHTQYKGSMKMSMRDGNEMTMNMNGRKVGACDLKQAARERDEKVAAVQRQSEQAKGQVAAMEQQQARNCAQAVETMDVNGLGLYGQCHREPGVCEQMAANESSKKTAAACLSSRAQLCKRYQTMDGFVKARGSKLIAETCSLDREALIAANCPRAAKSEHLAYLGRFCTAEAKPIAQEHCAGRGYTAAPDAKYGDFCSAYLARASLDEETAVPRRRSAAAQPAKAQPQDAVKEGVTQGINKLKGLFGR